VNTPLDYKPAVSSCEQPAGGGFSQSSRCRILFGVQLMGQKAQASWAIVNLRAGTEVCGIMRGLCMARNRGFDIPAAWTVITAAMT
jgi:hypothetical protein